MKLHVLSYNKKSQSFEDFVKNAMKQIQLGSIVSIELIEDTSTGNALLIAVTDRRHKKEQGISFAGVNSLHLVKEQIQYFLDSISNEVLKAISILPINGGRAIGIALVEYQGTENDGGESSRKETKRKRNKGADESSDAGTKG